MIKYHPTFKKIIELGSYEGYSLEWFHHQPEYYVGLEKFRESVERSTKKWGDCQNIKFISCEKITDVPDTFLNINFDCFITMETLEHMPFKLAENYLAKISTLVNGYVFITIPNESGPHMVPKFLYNCIFNNNREYSLLDLLYATFGKMNKVKGYSKRYDSFLWDNIPYFEHKGFDHMEMIDLIERYFEILEIKGLHFPRLPLCINFTIGIVAKSKEALE